MVFVAPEYMFLKEGYKSPKPIWNGAAWVDNPYQNRLKQNRFLEAADRRRIVDRLKAISREYGKQLVFVPGTIASRTPIPDDPEEANEWLESAQQDVIAGAGFIQTQILPNRFPQLKDPKITVAQLASIGEAGPMQGLKPRSPNRKMLELYKMLSRNANGEACYLASNVAFMFHNGVAVAHYEKRADYHEVLPRYGKHDTVYVPGIKSGRATVGGINFGIEVCLDHFLGVLQHAPTKTGVLPRIHLVCSASVGTDPAHLLVRQGGYILHASSNPACTHIWRKLRGFQEAENPRWFKIGPGLLKLGTIELDLHGL